MNEIREFLIFIAACARAYKLAKLNGAHYFGVQRNGMPHTVAFVGIGRAAIQVTQFAIDCNAIEVKPK